MFRTLLLTSFAGVGAANAPVPELAGRNNNPYSSCKSTERKCLAAWQWRSASAYCSSYLNVPRPTATKTRTVCTTTTTTITSFTSTATVPGATVTSTIDYCDSPNLSSGGSKHKIRDAIEEKRAANAIAQPGCLASNKNPSAISSACSCFHPTPCATTTTTTTTTTKTSTVTHDSATTVTGTATTTYEFTDPQQTFQVENSNGLFFSEAQFKGERSGGAAFLPESDDQGIIFQLDQATNNIKVVSSAQDGYNGAVAGEYTSFTNDPGVTDFSHYAVYAITDDYAGGDTYSPLTCSLSVVKVDDGTGNQYCPLTCQVRPGDVSTMPNTNMWELGPPGTGTGTTFDTYAVTNAGASRARRKWRGRIRRTGDTTG